MKLALFSILPTVKHLLHSHRGLLSILIPMPCRLILTKHKWAGRFSHLKDLGNKAQGKVWALPDIQPYNQLMNHSECGDSTIIKCAHAVQSSSMQTWTNREGVWSKLGVSPFGINCSFRIVSESRFFESSASSKSNSSWFKKVNISRCGPHDGSRLNIYIHISGTKWFVLSWYVAHHLRYRKSINDRHVTCTGGRVGKRCIVRYSGRLWFANTDW